MKTKSSTINFSSSPPLQPLKWRLGAKCSSFASDHDEPGSHSKSLGGGGGD